MLSSILKRFGELVRHRAFMGYAFTSSFQFAALLSFLSGSPFVFIERYGIAPRDYGLIFGGMIVFMTVGSLLNAKFAPVFGAGKVPRYAVIVPAIAGPAAMVMGWIEARYGTIGMWPFLLCFAPQIATISLIGPNSMAMALQRYPHMAGTALSLMGVMQFGIGALFGAVVGQALDGTIAPMTTAMGLAGSVPAVEPAARRQPQLARSRLQTEASHREVLALVISTPCLATVPAEIAVASCS